MGLDKKQWVFGQGEVAGEGSQVLVCPTGYIQKLLRPELS